MGMNRPIVPARSGVGPAAAGYRAAAARNRALLAAGFFLLLLLVGASLSMGRFPLSPGQILRALLHPEEAGAGSAASVVIWNLRLPRIAAAAASGAALGLSGMLTQTLLRNPLASPFTLGVSQGAAFGAAVAIVLLPGQAAGADGGRLWSLGSASGFAFLGACSGTLLILALARLRRLSPAAVVLAGVALGSLFASGTILIQCFASEEELARAVYWTFGDVGRPSWAQTGLIAASAAAAAAYCLARRWSFNALDAGDESALAVGVRVQRLRLTGMVLAALTASTATAFCGIIGYLGLLAPHIGRLAGGGDHRFLIPFSCLAGASLLVAADTAGRALIGSGALPAGVLTSFLGAPLFLFLLLRTPAL